MTGRFRAGKMSTFIRAHASTPAKATPATSTITVTGRRRAAAIGFIGAGRARWVRGQSESYPAVAPGGSRVTPRAAGFIPAVLLSPSRRDGRLCGRRPTGGPAMRAVEQVLIWAHGLSAAAWFGAIFYRTLIVDPKAFGYFADRADYERFSTHLAHGMRYVVTAGLLTCGLSGFALAGLRWEPANGVWVGLIAAKVGVWAAACGLFTYVSWVHWPWRCLAAPDEF